MIRSHNVPTAQWSQRAQNTDFVYAHFHSLSSPMYFYWGKIRTRKYVGTGPPALIVQGATTASATTTANEVWVNKRSGKYWKPGSRFYEKPKQGEFMSELEALDRGYCAAAGTGQQTMPRNQKL